MSSGFWNDFEFTILASQNLEFKILSLLTLCHNYKNLTVYRNILTSPAAHGHPKVPLGSICWEGLSKTALKFRI